MCEFKFDCFILQSSHQIRTSAGGNIRRQLYYGFASDIRKTK